MSTHSPHTDPAGGHDPSPGGHDPSPGGRDPSPGGLGRPDAADFYRVNRGGGLFSEAVSQQIGARIAALAYRHDLHPTVLTVANLALGSIVSIFVIATADPVASSPLLGWPVGLLALVGWQLAYALDCADGQLARVTGQTSPAGGRVDVLCDVAAQVALVAALAATAEAQVPQTPAWLIAAFAGTWMVNLVTSVMQAGPQSSSMITSRSLPVRIVKLVRDYGAVIALAGAVLTVAPQWTIWLIALFTLVNGGFLGASIAFAGRDSLRTEGTDSL